MSTGLPPPAAPEKMGSRRKAWARQGTPKPGQRRITQPRKPARSTAVKSVRLAQALWDAIDTLAVHYDVERTTIVKRFFEDGLRRYDKPELGLVEAAGLAPKDNPFAQMPSEPSFPVKQPEPTYESYEDPPMQLPPSNVAFLPQGAPLP